MEDQYLPPLEPTDEILVERILQQDVPAFSVLYDRYAQAIYALAAHMIGPPEAEEIVQEVFLRLWNKANQFDPARGSFGSWLMTIARHRILDELRNNNQQRLLAVEDINQLLESMADPMVDVEEEVWQRERNAAILNQMKTLPAEQQRALILAYFGGFSQSTIAEQLGWPLGTVKKRIRLGLQKLRTFLTESRLETLPGSDQAKTKK